MINGECVSCHETFCATTLENLKRDLLRHHVDSLAPNVVWDSRTGNYLPGHKCFEFTLADGITIVYSSGKLEGQYGSGMSVYKNTLPNRTRDGD